MKNLKELLKRPVIWLFALFILGFTGWDLLTPDKEVSETENRVLNQKPSLTLTTLFAKGDKAYNQRYEKYINDQFVLRDEWISLKSRAESLLMKIENNGIAYGEDGHLFEKVVAVDEENLSDNIQYVNEFLEKYPDLPVTFSVIPNAYTILTDKLPFGFEEIVVDQNEWMAKVYEQVDGGNLKELELTDALASHADEYIYYRTDHHWTTYGAYFAYCEYVESLGLTPVSFEELQKVKGGDVADFHGTFDAKAKKADIEPDVITWYDIPCTVEVNQEPVDSLHDLSKFEVRDKYAALMRSNNALTVLYSECNQNQTDGETSRVLVIKDSYGNSMIPYLCYNFDEVYAVDLRYLGKLSVVLQDTEFDDVLILYNFANFVDDTNIPKLRY